MHMHCKFYKIIHFVLNHSRREYTHTFPERSSRAIPNCLTNVWVWRVLEGVLSVLNINQRQGVGMEKQNMLTLGQCGVTSTSSLSVVTKPYFSGYMYEGFIIVMGTDMCMQISVSVCL